MKKIFCLLFLLFVLVSCDNKTNNTNNNINNDPINDKEDVKETKIEEDSNDILVAYFSVTGNTKKLAEYAQEHLDSDLFEIVPEEAYTSADINYNSDCRANREQNDSSARPKIKNKIEDMSKYDFIVLAYPIWWGEAPKIMYTFVESYNLENKTILPFCTSGSSPIGSSAKNLAKVTKGNWLEGKRFSSSTTKEEMNNWLDQNIDIKEEKMILEIDGNKLNVNWEDNNSVKELKNLAKNNLSINMKQYGGFEQTGSIGSSVARNDVQMDVVPGDIVLYNGNAISVFYNPSSWSYTKLGHINLSNDELNTLLNKVSITFVLKIE